MLGLSLFFFKIFFPHMNSCFSKTFGFSFLQLNAFVNNCKKHTKSTQVLSLSHFFVSHYWPNSSHSTCEYVGLHTNIVHYIDIHTQAEMTCHLKWNHWQVIHTCIIFIYPSVCNLAKIFTAPGTEKSNPVLFHSNSCKKCNSQIAEGMTARKKRQERKCFLDWQLQFSVI